MRWTINIEAGERDVEITVDDNGTTIEPVDSPPVIEPPPIEPPPIQPPDEEVLLLIDFEGIRP